jgi:hypothetical protein
MLKRLVICSAALEGRLLRIERASKRKSRRSEQGQV